MYAISVTDGFKADIKKIDRYWADVITARLASEAFLSDPKAKCKPLVGNLAGRWRYRVGDYRVVLEIHDNELVVVALHAAHRRHVYDQH